MSLTNQYPKKPTAIMQMPMFIPITNSTTSTTIPIAAMVNGVIDVKLLFHSFVYA